MANNCLRQRLAIDILRRGDGMPVAEAFWRHVARHPDMSNVEEPILFQTQGNVVYRHGSGRPRSTTNTGDRLIVLQAWSCYRLMNVTPSRKRSRWLNELGFLPYPFGTVSMTVAIGLNKLQISFQCRITTYRHMYNRPETT